MKGKKLLAAVLALMISITTVRGDVFASERGVSQFRETASLQEGVSDGNIVSKEDAVWGENPIHAEDSWEIWDGSTTESVYEGANYRVIFSLTGYWEGGYNASVEIENTGDSIIENWYLQFSYSDEISSIWNAEIQESVENRYVLKNAEWNRNIAVGGSVCFGFSSAEIFTGFPDTYELIGGHTETAREDYSINYYSESDWGSGFTGKIVITNHTDKIIEDWVLEFDFAREISTIWDAAIESCENNHYVIKNSGYNADIPAGQSITFGFTGKNGTASDIPQNYCLYSHELYRGDSMERDTDGDGIVDGLETLWGLDYKNIDSDGDGLTDYEEIYITLTNPLAPDTDSNGICDAEEDMDGDGIDNRTEIAYGTDPLSADTDGDNLTDYEEIYIYYTNPLNTDTDGDGLTDYDDVFLGFSPLLADTDGNGIPDPDEKIEQVVEETFENGDGRGVTKVSVTLGVAGNAQTNVAIVNTYGTDTLSSDVVGLIGVPVEIHTKMPFDTAQISFYYDEAVLGGAREEDLAVLWYDEANNWYQILDQENVVDTVNNKVSYVTTHFSTYMLVDSKAWYDAWRENIDYRNSVEGDEKHYFDIAFVVDVSGSMSGTRISSAKQAMVNFVNSMQSGDEAAIISFHNRASVICDFTEDGAALKRGINSLCANGGTNVNNGLLGALDLYKDRESERQKIIVLICDGDVNYVQSTINSCVEQSIQIYAVNVASVSAHVNLEKMAKQTGGQYYYGSSADLITEMLSFVQDDTLNQIDATDTDGDGLYDIYETAGMRLPNGQIVYTDPGKADTDGDSLSDFQETGLVYNVDDRYIGFGIYKNTKYFMMRSNPANPDTDGDGIIDSKDLYPWKMDMAEVAKLDNIYVGVEYLNIEENENSFTHGGKQGWWSEKTTKRDELNYADFATDKNYRLWKMGCGVVAACDTEIYLMQQNAGYKSILSPLNDISYDSDTGTIQKEDYMEFLEYNADLVYGFGGGILHYVTGLPAKEMETGLTQFLRKNNHEKTSVQWAPHLMSGKEDQKKQVLQDIETMLEDNIPVIFSYYTFDDDNRIILYDKLEGAKEKDDDNNDNRRTQCHYMTIIGLYKYLDEDSLDYEYIMKVVSWGKVYFIRYDQYSDSFSYPSNILRIN